MIYYIIDVDEKNKLPTIPLSITAIENPPQKFEKKEQNHNNKHSKNNTENFKTEQELNNFMECTDEMGNDGSDCFEEDNEKGNTTCTFKISNVNKEGNLFITYRTCFSIFI